MKILAIESSCDETSCAIVQDGTNILSNIVASSHEMHEKYGGIVPEVAARKQLEFIIPTLDEVLSRSKLSIDSIDAIAVTVGPGLIGSLLVGIETAKSIAALYDKPIIPVNHVLAHMYANFIQSNTQSIAKIVYPAISLVVSGGHTELYTMKSPKELTWLGGTIDDAAGEAFDKSARLMGFGNGGGLAIQNAASHARPNDHNGIVRLPRPMLDIENYLNFSFSGLKTAIWREWNKYSNPSDEIRHAFAYEVQETICDILVKKTIRAIEQQHASSLLLSGGVAANLRLREKLQIAIEKYNPEIKLFVPAVSLCTDNAAYIASYAFFRGQQTTWETISAEPDLDVEVKM